MAAWSTFLQTLALCMMRPLGVMLLLPVTEARLLGGSLVRNALTLIIALPVLPVALSDKPIASADLTNQFITLVASELSIGLYIGLLAAIPFWAITVAGEMIDNVRGAGLSGILNPSSGEEVSLFSVLFLQLLSALFFMTGGFHQLLDAIYRSYTLLPIGVPLSVSRKTADFMIAQWRVVFDLGIGFALPAVVMMLMVDFSLGLINRSVEQLEVFSLAMPIKSLLACLALALGLRIALDGFLERINGIWPLVRHLLTSS
jgi:type III secretion protein T